MAGRDISRPPDGHWEAGGGSGGKGADRRAVPRTIAPRAHAPRAVNGAFHESCSAGRSRLSTTEITCRGPRAEITGPRLALPGRWKALRPHQGVSKQTSCDAGRGPGDNGSAETASKHAFACRKHPRSLASSPDPTATGSVQPRLPWDLRWQCSYPHANG